jgi:hypothetical protein
MTSNTINESLGGNAKVSHTGRLFGGPYVPMEKKILHLFQTIHRLDAKSKGRPTGPEGAVAAFRTQVMVSDDTDYIGFREKPDGKPEYYKM